MYFDGGELLSKRKRRKSGLEQNFVGVGVADAAEKTRVSEGALQGVICGEQNGGELLRVGLENLNATGIQLAKSGLARNHMERGAFLGASFGPEKGSHGKVKRREAARWRDFHAAGPPVKPARNHQMQNEPEVVFEANANPFSDAT